MSNESIEDHFARLLEDFDFDVLKHLLPKLEATRVELLRGVLGTMTLAALLERLGGRLETCEGPLDPKSLTGIGPYESCSATVGLSFAHRGDNVIITDKLGVENVDRALCALRLRLLDRDG